MLKDSLVMEAERIAQEQRTRPQPNRRQRRQMEREWVRAQRKQAKHAAKVNLKVHGTK